MSTIGERIRQRRIEIGLTQPELADRLGLTKGAVNHWERDRNLPEHWNIEPVAAALGCDPGWLLTGETRARTVDRTPQGIVGPEGLVSIEPLPVDDVGPELGHGLIMLLVRSDIMTPRIVPGDLVYMTVRPCSPLQLLGHHAVCLLADHRMVLRRIEPSARSAELVTLTAPGRVPMADLEVGICHPLVALAFPAWREMRDLFLPARTAASGRRARAQKEGTEP